MYERPRGAGPKEEVHVALGSTSTLKIHAVLDAFSHFGYAADILPVKAKSGVSDQPEGFDAMMQGARSRALEALSAASVTLGIGLESGIVQVGKCYFDPAIAVVVDRDGNEYVGCGPLFPIPAWAVAEARTSELGAVVMKRGAPDKNPMAYFSNGSIDRTEILSSAVKMALVPYFFPHRYKP